MHASQTGVPAHRAERGDIVLLGLLLNHPMHGYEIAEQLSQPEMQAWLKMGRTSIYYALGRLEKNGLVSRHSERHGGKPERAVYSVTGAGRAAFVAGVERSLSSGEGPTDDFDVALYFSNRLDTSLARSGVGERLLALESQAKRLGTQARETGMNGDSGLLLVLEHRLAVLRADIDFLTAYVRMLDSGPGAVILSGSLSETSLGDLLLGLAAARRTGVFWVKTHHGDVGLCFDAGRLYGVLPIGGMSVEESLRAAFRVTAGTYSFEPSDILEALATSVGTLAQAILLGARGITDPDLLSRTQPSPETLLDIRPGYEGEIIGVDLTEQERQLLTEIDGARTLGELARSLGWRIEDVRSTSYPLWLVGWAVRTGRSKRDLLLATAAYVRRWSEAIKMFAGARGEESVFQDVGAAVAARGVVDFREVDHHLERTRVAIAEEVLAGQARDYIEWLNQAVAARLGGGIADDIKAGYARQLSPDELSTLESHGVVMQP